MNKMSFQFICNVFSLIKTYITKLGKYRGICSVLCFSVVLIIIIYFFNLCSFLIKKQNSRKEKQANGDGLQETSRERQKKSIDSR